MIVIMSSRAGAREIEAVVNRLKGAGFEVHVSRGAEQTVLGVVGEDTPFADLALEAMPGVEKVVPVLPPYKLASRSYKSENTVIRVGNVEIGGRAVHVMAGPCAVESREQVMACAGLVKSAGASILRGGAFKPRTSPYSFQGLEKEGLLYLAEARSATGLPVVTEALDISTLPLVAEYADIIQIGARNMQNFPLLKEAASLGKPILLKRSPAATVEEWLMAAEYILAGGNGQVILCERGIRTFNGQTRYTLDLSAVPVVKSLSHLPVVVDPSHATGKWRYVLPMARAAVAAGADGLLVEVHPDPARALCDGQQALCPKAFLAMMEDVKKVAGAVGREC